ncbi:MAG: (Fe-S)-binding protein [Desulfurococcales archaeon]|nr:(Fe-S)-binding protein [Desulfurococcales archaeon]
MSSTKEIISFISENTRRTNLPLPAPRDALYRWALDVKPPRKGEYILYTGGLYQLIPQINSLVNQLESLTERKTGALALRFAKAFSKLIDLSKIAKPRKKDVEYSNSILRGIAALLDSAGVNYGYLYEDDMYSGILLHDMGLEQDFAIHAGKVYSKLKEHNASKVITVDPHTTYALTKLYPEYIDNYNLEVVNYLQLLHDKTLEGELTFKQGEKGEVVIHDPCYYARFLEILDPPRALLEAAGYKVLEPRRTRKMTYCCGGPIESLSPRLALKISETRVKELLEKSPRIVTLCPICYANLSRSTPNDSTIKDIAIYLSGALPGERER